jgi:hypothetical protein
LAAFRVPDETRTKPFSIAVNISGNKPRLQLHWDQTTGCGHAGNHPQRYLSPIPQGRRLWHGGDPGSAPMIEIVTALLAFLSIGVFLAHAFDAYRTG